MINATQRRQEALNKWSREYIEKHNRLPCVADAWEAAWEDAIKQLEAKE